MVTRHRLPRPLAVLPALRWCDEGALEANPQGAELEPATDMFLVYLRVFAEKCGLLDFLKLFVFSLASRKPPGAAVPEDNLEVIAR